MRLLRRGVTLLLAAVAVPAFAFPATAPTKAETSEADGLAKVRAALEAEDLVGARRAADAALKRKPGPDAAMRLHMLRAITYLAAGDAKSATSAVQASASADPSSPLPYSFQAEFGAWPTGQRLGALRTLVERYPDAVPELDMSAIYSLFNRADEEGLKSETDVLRIALAVNGWGGEGVQFRNGAAKTGVAAALRQKDLEIAAKLAGKVKGREPLTEMLTDRSYEPIWSQLETAVGEHMATAHTEAVTAAELAFEVEESIATRHDLMNAYFEAGRIKDADRIGAGFAQSAEAIAGLDEKGAWLINDHAIVLENAGRVADADKRLATLAGLSIAERPWLINFTINRASRLVRSKRFAEAAEAVSVARAQVGEYGSGYAQQLVRRDDLCTRHGLDPKADVAALLEELIANEKDSAESVVAALHCLDRTLEGEPIVIRALAVERERPNLISSLQPRGALHNRSPSIWDDGWEKLAARPAVIEALNKVGRPLPEKFWPAAR